MSSNLRYQVVDGELLVSPGPRRIHQKAVVELIGRLREYLDRWEVGDLLAGPGQIIPDEYTGVQPDVFVIPLVDGQAPEDWDTNGRLLLAVEVVDTDARRVEAGRCRRGVCARHRGVLQEGVPGGLKDWRSGRPS